jgi:glycosyltransferase involved in cell wall biosynthesis
LEKAGVKVYAPTERLAFDDFMLAVARSHLTLSPEGYGYHCFRHCEAMLLGSVPVINQPAEPMVTDLEDGRNCVLYRDDRPGALREAVLSALKDKAHLKAWGSQLRRYAREHYSMPTVGRAVWEKLR